MEHPNLPERWIDNIANWATLGGIYLGIDGIALAYRDNGSKPWAVFCFFVAYLSAIKLWDLLFRSMSDEKKTPIARLFGGGVVIVMFALGGLILGLFRFSNMS